MVSGDKLVMGRIQDGPEGVLQNMNETKNEVKMNDKEHLLARDNADNDN